MSVASGSQPLAEVGLLKTYFTTCEKVWLFAGHAGIPPFSDIGPHVHPPAQLAYARVADNRQKSSTEYTIA